MPESFCLSCSECGRTTSSQLFNFGHSATIYGFAKEQRQVSPDEGASNEVPGPQRFRSVAPTMESDAPACWTSGPHCLLLENFFNLSDFLLNFTGVFFGVAFDL
jgi:hypothetical protein